MNGSRWNRIGRNSPGGRRISVIWNWIRNGNWIWYDLKCLFVEIWLHWFFKIQLTFDSPSILMPLNWIKGGRINLRWVEPIRFEPVGQMGSFIGGGSIVIGWSLVNEPIRLDWLINGWLMISGLEWSMNWKEMKVDGIAAKCLVEQKCGLINAWLMVNWRLCWLIIYSAVSHWSIQVDNVTSIFRPF